jgi:hypothetical protein
MSAEHYRKMMTKVAREANKLKDHEPLPAGIKKHLDHVDKLWVHLAKMERDERVRALGACFFESLNWVLPRDRQTHFEQMVQGIEAATQTVLQEARKAGPSIILPPGTQLS